MKGQSPTTVLPHPLYVASFFFNIRGYLIKDTRIKLLFEQGIVRFYINQGRQEVTTGNDVTFSSYI